MMNRNVLCSVILGFLLLIAAVQSASAAPDAQSTANMPIPGGTFSQKFSQNADRRWPQSEVVKGYNRAADLYGAGKSDEGLMLVRKLVHKPLLLAPDSVLNDARNYITDFTTYRVHPLISELREISRGITENAEELSKSGQRKAAMEVLTVKLNLARQVIHARPHDLITISAAIGIWKGTWAEAAKILAASGDTARVVLARRYSDRAQRFVLQKLRPYSDREAHDEESLARRTNGMSDVQVNKLTSQLLKRQQVQMGNLISIWDKEVDSTACDHLLGS
jgi:hypothetical protein